jgi:hypothetical protein
MAKDKAKTADKFVGTPKAGGPAGMPHNKVHNKFYTPDVKAPKGR